MEATRDGVVVPGIISIRGERLCPHGNRRNPACACYLHSDPGHTPERCVQQVFLEQSAESVLNSSPSH